MSFMAFWDQTSSHSREAHILLDRIPVLQAGQTTQSAEKWFTQGNWESGTESIRDPWFNSEAVLSVWEHALPLHCKDAGSG